METITNTKAKGLNFVHLPGFAKYLLSEKLEEFVFLYRQIMIESDFPLLKHLNGITEIEQQIVALHLITNLLTNLSQNNAPRQIQDILNNWQNNQLPFLDKYEITTGDITRFSYTRKKTFLHFLPAYCSDSATILELIEEIDRFLMHYDLAASETYINLLQSRINDHSHLINKVNNTLPGAVYIFDLHESKNIYANEKLDRIIGYTTGELNERGINAIANFIHPEDADTIKKHYTEIEKASDGDILSYRFRVRQKDGSYKWIRNFEAVFKRDGNGKASQLICISLDVDREKKTAEQLKQREEQLLEAQEIAQLGSFSWDLRGNTSEASPELTKILGIPANEFNNFIEHVHPEDKAYVEKALAEAMKTGMYECEYRYRTREKEKFIWSRGKVFYEKDVPVMITGTVMDITDRQLLLQKAQENERLYQEAEAISNIGNVNWDLASGEITWSDELYRIFEIDPAKEKITLEKFESRVHPNDRNNVMLDISEALKNNKSYNHLYRICVGNGRIKNIHGRGEVILDKKGKAIKVIGTAQDVTERQKMIEQLQESEKLFKQAQSMAQMGNWSLNIETNEVKWSDEMFRIYSLPEDEQVTPEQLFAMVHTDDYGKLIERFEACRKERSPFDMIHRIVLPSGQTKTLHQKAEFIFNEQANSKLMVGTTQDVTDQFAVQQELKEKENFIRKIADATPSIISSYNINTGKYVFVSEGIQKLLGYDPDEALEGGIPFFNSIIHPDDLAGVIEKNTKALEEANKKDTGKENIVEFIYRLKHSKGHYRWFHTYGTVFDRNNSGKVEHLLNISLDVTESIEATKKIEEQEYFIQQIADASPTILYLFDVETNNFAYLNREIFYVLGYTPEEIIDMGENAIYSLYHPDDRNLLPERKGSGAQFEHKESMVQYECRLKSKKGEWIWFLVREIVFRKNENGQVQQVLGAALDINKRKEMERTLLQNSFQLEQSNSSLEEFAYVASHDLKEPLRKISTFGDRMAATQMEKLTDDGKIYLKKIVDASQRMQVMIDDLLSVSMISGNRSFENFSLQEILEDARQAVEFKIEQKGAVINSTTLPEANIVPSQFRQLFQNLLSNSLKFSKEGVQPVITISHKFLKPADVTHLQLPKANDYLQLEFDDNGIGFENESAGKIFQIFHRLHGRSEFEGTGIGLAICKKIVEHHGGVIFATGAPGQGSKFTIILPR